MDLLLSWLIGPALLLLVTIGLCLLVERLAGFAVPGALRPALGLAALIVVAQFATTSGATAKLTMPAVLFLAAIGFVLGRGHLARPGGAELAVGTIVFFLFASPFLLSGAASWAGYLRLDDTATWMAITQHAFEHGRGVGALPPSTHDDVLSMYLGKGYPIGGFVPAGALSFLAGKDIAFTLQPAMAFSAAALALTLLELLRRPLRSDALAGAIAVVGSLSSLLLAYYLWGENKELAAAMLLALGPALAGPAMASGWPQRSFIGFGLAIGALFAVLGPGALLWTLPTLLPILISLARDRGGQLAIELGGRVAILTVALAIPVLVTPEGLFNPVDPVLTESSEVSALNGALNPLQVAGLWPAGDFRNGPHAEPLVLALAGLCLLLAAVAVIACARLSERRGLPFAAYTGGGAVGAAAIALLGSPWVDAKAMAAVSPALLSAALAGVALLARHRSLRLPAVAVAALIAGVAGWSAFLAYQDASLAPHDQYAELERIGDRFDGQGPALATDASFYGARHFLSGLDPESTVDFHPRTLVLVGGSVVGPKSGFVDIGDIRPDQLGPYNLLVLPRSPATSRPSRPFELAYLGDYYEVWRRKPGAPPPDGSLALGSALDAGGVARCDDVRRLAHTVGPDGELVAARVADPVTVKIGRAELPAGWKSLTPFAVDAGEPGTVTKRVRTSRGTYEVLVGGDIYGRALVEVDGHEAGSLRGEIYPTGDYKRIGTVELEPGAHEVTLRYEGASLHPGSAGAAEPLGPLLLAPAGERDRGTVSVPARRYRALCDRRWDWIEAYRR